MKARRRNERSIQLHLQRLSELGHSSLVNGVQQSATGSCWKYCLLLFNAIIILVLGLHVLQSKEKLYNGSSISLFSSSSSPPPGLGGAELGTADPEPYVELFDDTTLIEQEVIDGSANYLIMGSAFGVDDYHISIFCDSLRRAGGASARTAHNRIACHHESRALRATDEWWHYG